MKKTTSSHTLMVYIEPTPYVLGLVREIEQQAEFPVKIFFIKENFTQPWGLSLEGYNVSVLPQGPLAAALQIYRYIAGGPAVLHLAGWGHPLMLFAMMLALVFRVPVTVESDTQLPFTLPLWKRAVKAVFYPLLFRIPSMVLPGGCRQADYFRHYGVPDEKILPAQMTVDVSAIQERCEKLGAQGRMAIRQRLDIGQDETVFIFVGRLVAHKGIRDLLAAFEQISRQRKDVHLFVVGDGPELDQVAAAGQDNPAIRPMGRLDQQGVIEMFFASDVAVVPSHFEPWGLVVNEAMAAGLPVIASTRVGAVDDLVLDGKTGIVFKGGDIDDLSRAMATLAREVKLRRRLAAEGKELISGWTLEKGAEIILSAWQHIESRQVFAW